MNYGLAQPTPNPTTTIVEAYPLKRLLVVPTMRFPVALFLALAFAGLPVMLGAQEQQRLSKVPVIDKIASGTTQQAFMGVIKSIDLESEVLNVDNLNGKSTEIFPIKKKIRVVTADGSKLKLEKLKPGTNVLVYFDQKGDHRTVTQIVIMAGGAAKKKAPPS